MHTNCYLISPHSTVVMCLDKGSKASFQLVYTLLSFLFNFHNITYRSSTSAWNESVHVVLDLALSVNYIILWHSCQLFKKESRDRPHPRTPKERTIKQPSGEKEIRHVGRVTCRSAQNGRAGNVASWPETAKRNVIQLTKHH